jgi:hypothetical protein
LESILPCSAISFYFLALITPIKDQNFTVLGGANRKLGSGEGCNKKIQLARGKIRFSLNFWLIFMVTRKIP